MRTSKVFVVRLAAASLGIAGLWMAWPQNQPAPQPLTLQKVTANLYVLSGDGGNAAFLPTSEGTILVDDKFAQDVPQIIEKIKSVTDQPIRYVLNTHQHGDHTGGNAGLLAAHAEIVIHKNARANMQKGEMPGLPHITYADETQVFAGGREVIAHHFGRGHTNGDAVIYFPSERVLHTGDLLVAGAPFCDTSAGGSIKEWDQTLQKALQYDFDTVIPGHGPVMKRADLEKYIHTVATIRDRVKQACAGGASDAVKRIDLKDLGFTTGGMFERGVPGMCQELAQ